MNSDYALTHRLTPRQRELLPLLVQRLTYREIAEQMGVEPHTINNYASAVYSKLRVRGRLELIKLVSCQREGNE